MGYLNGIKAAVKRFHDTWVSPKDEPQKPTPGELHYIAPGGRLEIIAELGSGKDERDVKRVLDILLKSDNDYYFGDNGVTD